MKGGPEEEPKKFYLQLMLLLVPISIIMHLSLF